ncbi:tetratricopeptide repeat protein [Spirosoma endophyticum]|uniref:Tetratricopeptide repeat-containing protein n=1 Tax=Spirosoma endophyticum TaxID=662367 RepID=A0A1I1F8G9_9BACT|nr:tetratricopeptide repeat protein [Spirosoma endophyticum]SFB95246.1 Tetratricopeptide repeat-containing protein [Spirosoma endophyticum]
MKQVFVILVACCLSVGAYAQQAAAGAGASALDQAAMDSFKKEKEKSDKDIADPKASAKASTWMDRAKTYQNIAGQYIRIDSAAATTAYDAFKKVIELDKDKKGGPGKLAKEAEEALKGQAMYGAFMQQGVAKFQAKNYADAMKSMTVAGEINPKDTLAPLYTAIAAQQIKDNATAKTQLEKYIAGGGKDAAIYGSLAMLYRGDNEVDKAIAALDKGIALAPGNKDLANEKINLMLTSNRMDEAITGMKAMVEKDPNNVQNLVNLSIVYNNIASKGDEEIRKLEGDTKKGGNTAKQLTDSKSIIDAYNSEITRLGGLIKKQPKNADLKRQLTDVQKKLAEQKTEMTKLEADAKAAAANAGAAADSEKRLAELKQKKAETKALEKQYLEKALAVDANNYDANYAMGIFAFNEAVELKKAVDKMDMAEYSKVGKEADGKVCGKFKQALPYFQKAKTVKDEPELTDNLTNTENILKQYEEKKIVCIESK